MSVYRSVTLVLLLAVVTNASIPVQVNPVPVSALRREGGNSSSTSNSDQYFLLRTQICGGRETIHGLWPQWANGCDGPTFDLNAIKSLMSEMDQDWPSCVGSGGNTQFWSHEWSKHGTCSGMQELAYFTEVLTLFSKYSDGSTNYCFDMNFNPITCPNDHRYEH